MRALTCPRYGVATWSARPVPAPAPGELQVQVLAASVNSADLHMLHGDPWPMRLALGLRRPRLKALGADVVGRVTAVGDGVAGVRVGDEVVADLSGHGFGTFADVVCAPATAFVEKPAALSVEAAAALPMAAVTALQGLRDVAGVRPGQRVLVNGASSGVGSCAVQLAVHLGATVTAVCSAPKRHRVAAHVGAGVEVLDVDTADRRLHSGALDGAFDAVFDAAVYRSPRTWARALTPGGVFVCAGGAFSAIVWTGLVAPLWGRLTQRRYRAYVAAVRADDLEAVLQLAATGVLRPLLDDQAFALADAERALAHVHERRACGKVILRAA